MTGNPLTWAASHDTTQGYEINYRICMNLNYLVACLFLCMNVMVVLNLGYVNLFLSGAARGRDAVAWATSVPAPSGSATRKKGSRGTRGMSLTTRSTTSSPSCLRLVSVKGHPTLWPPKPPPTSLSRALIHCQLSDKFSNYANPNPRNLVLGSPREPAAVGGNCHVCLIWNESLMFLTDC